MTAALRCLALWFIANSLPSTTHRTRGGSALGQTCSATKGCCRCQSSVPLIYGCGSTHGRRVVASAAPAHPRKCHQRHKHHQADHTFDFLTLPTFLSFLPFAPPLSCHGRQSCAGRCVLCSGTERAHSRRARQGNKSTSLSLICSSV